MKRFRLSRQRVVIQERGSVLVIALLALVLLGAIGLSLTLVTETEMLIGGNEQVMTETFYAAETGVGVVLGQTTLGNTDEQCLAAVAKEEDDSAKMVGVRKLGYSIDTTSVYPVAFDVAAYSKANAGRGDVHCSGFFHGSSRAQRGSWPSADDVPREAGEDLAAIDFTVQSQKAIDVSFFVSPIQSPIDLGAFDHPDLRGCEPHPAHDGGVCVVTEPTEVSCGDGADNDCDGQFDCDDPDCGADPACPS